MSSPPSEPHEHPETPAAPAVPEPASAPATGAQPVDLSKPAPPADQPIWAIGPGAVGNGEPGYAAPPPDWVPVVDEPAVRTTPRDWLIEILAALVVAVVLTGLGAGLAYVWEAISPRTVLEMSANGAVYTQPNPEGYVAGESVYLLMTAGLGIVSAVAVWLLLRRRRGPIMLTGLAIGSVAGATLMAWLGQRIGLAEYRRLLTDAPVGTRFEIPVKVYSAIIDLAGFKIQGAVLVQAMIAVAIYTFLAGFYPTASLRPERAPVHFMPPYPGPDGPPYPGPGAPPYPQQGPGAPPYPQQGPGPQYPEQGPPGGPPTQPGGEPLQGQPAAAQPGGDAPGKVS
ncbi:DUF2567 domain-containing protein [Virgisporangium ochraceum]|uniref:DUF2567 domain-containing protein n=1 Tax=Virgisporangium ochraceum TaxID=65505 RepID=UPI0019424B0D|nr:DUF2567 domain-containing protein [Virgisporangium ochraceum]